MSNLDARTATNASSSGGDQANRDPGPGSKIYLALIPWVLFTLLAQHSTLKAAAVAALFASAAVALPSLLAGRPKLIEGGAILAFAGFTIVAFTADVSATQWVVRYARAIAAALLALIAFCSLPFTPFTAQYARESVPRRVWRSPQFERINRELTLMWALVFAAMVPSHLIADAINSREANVIFNWALPIILIVWAAKRTAAISGAGRGSRSCGAGVTN